MLNLLLGGFDPSNSGKKSSILYVHVNKNYKFDKYTLIIKWYKILFDDNIVKCDYNMFNFKIYLILKNYDILCILIIKLYKILFDNNIVICDYNMFNFKIYLILKNYDIL